ncbi:TPA: sugar kinase [Klebsiella pneumoniae]|nr:sugar kinase [Klebsiella pneumoniae]
MKQNIKIAIIGECMIELSRNNEGLRQGFGGDTLNTAIYLSRLLSVNIEIQYVTCLGEDEYSTMMLNTWNQEKLRTDLVLRTPTRLPGLYFIETDPTGERRFHFWRGESAAKLLFSHEGTPDLCSTLSGFDALYVSGVTLGILDESSLNKLFAVLEACRSKGGQIIFDNNYRQVLWASPLAARKVYARMLALTDMAFLTLDDENQVWGESTPDQAITRSIEAGVKEIIIKRGSQSCIAWGDGQKFDIPAYLIEASKVVDTTAAGDSFSAGYMASRFRNGDVPSSVACGHQLASRVIQYPGAIIPATAMPGIPC